MSLLHASFDSHLTSSLAFAAKDGISILDLDHLEQSPFKTSQSGVGLVHILKVNGTTMLAVVGSGDLAGSSPRKLKVLDAETKKTACEITFQSSILSCAISSQFMALCLESSIHIVELVGMKVVLKISTASNAKGIMTMSKTSLPTVLAYPSSDIIGEFNAVIIDVAIASSTASRTSCIAHKSRLFCLQMNPTGTLIASASITGTIIRVFDTQTSSKLHEFRRGLQQANISSLLFGLSDSLLLASSSSGTVHIFQLQREEKSEIMTHDEVSTNTNTTPDVTPSSMIGMIFRAAITSAQVELRQGTGSSRAAYIARIPNSEGPVSMCLTYPGNGEKRLFVVTLSGYLYR